MEASAAVSAHLDSLGLSAEATGDGGWRLALDSAGHPLSIELVVRGPLLRAEAAVLPPGLLDPHQLLFWNGQAPLVCFAESAAGEVLVCGEVPLTGLDAELLDRFLGLVHASATRARQFVLPAA